MTSEAANRYGPDEALLRRAQVQEFFRLGRTKTYELIGSPGFPAPVHVAGVAYWLRSDLLEFVRSHEQKERAAAPQ